jgi:hypothetical protein
MDGGPMASYLIASIFIFGTILFIIELKKKQ